MSASTRLVPFLSAADIQHRVHAIAELGRRLERAVAGGTLRDVLDESDAQTVLGQPALDHYLRCLAIDGDPPPFRRVNGAVLAERLASSLKTPAARFSVRPAPGSDVVAGARAPRLPRFEHEPPASARVAAAVVITGPDPPLTLRLDQLLASREWGIGFEFEDMLQTAWLENIHVYRVIRRWTSDLNDLLKVDAWLNRRPRITQVPRLDGAGAPGFRFEQLTLDLLNRDAYRARRAPLREDVLQKTDLRVHVEGLDRSRGVRVQVGLGARFDAVDRKRETIRGSSPVVLLTPATLVTALIDGRLLDSAERAALWQALPDAPPDAGALSREIRDLFVAAMNHPSADPRGPSAALPPELGTAVMRFVDREARPSDQI